MIQIDDKQMLKVFVKKTEPDGTISLDRYGTFDNEEGFVAWLDRFTLDINAFKKTAEQNRLSSIKEEKNGNVQYDLYLKLYDEVDGDDFLKEFESW